MNKEFIFDFEVLEKTRVPKKNYEDLSKMLDDCGLGLLNIDEYINNWKF